MNLDALINMMIEEIDLQVDKLSKQKPECKKKHAERDNPSCCDKFLKCSDSPLKSKDKKEGWVTHAIKPHKQIYTFNHKEYDYEIAYKKKDLNTFPEIKEGDVVVGFEAGKDLRVSVRNTVYLYGPRLFIGSGFFNNEYRSFLKIDEDRASLVYRDGKLIWEKK